MEEIKKIDNALFIQTKLSNVKDQTIYDLKIGCKLIDFLQEVFPNGMGYPCGFYLNGKELKVEELDYVVKKGDNIVCINKPQDPVSILITIAINIAVSLAVSFILSKLMPSSNKNPNTQDSNYESVYSTNVSQIQAKKGGTIPVSYGCARIYPNLITNQYSRYENNNEVIFLTTVVGMGKYECIQGYLDDNKIEFMDTVSSTTQLDLLTINDYLAIQDYFTYDAGTGIYTYYNFKNNEEIIIFMQNSTTERDKIAEYNFYYNLGFEYIDTINADRINNANGFYEAGDDSTKLLYNKYFDNSKLVAKNKNSINTIKYILFHDENQIKNPGDYVRQQISPNYRHICREVDEVSNLTLSDDYQEFGFYNVNDKYGNIDKLEVDVSFQGGLYQTTKQGEFQNLTQTLRIYIYGYNDNNIKIYDTYQDFNYTSNSKKILRFTHEFNVPAGKYKVKIKRMTASYASSTTKSGDPTVERIKGFEVENDFKYKNITMAVFKIESNQELSQRSSLKINLLTRRLRDIPSTSKYLLTLRDFVEDIWTNKEYGLGESLDKLDIRAELNENCNVILDEQENGFKLISDVLKSYGYIFYPTFNKFVVEKDTYRNEITYFFTENNSKDFSLNFSLSKKDEVGDGVSVKYLKQYDVVFSDVKFPENSVYPTDLIGKGITTEKEAMDFAILSYNKLNKRSRTASLTTELEGYIPELNSKVAVCRNYINDSFSLLINNFYNVQETFSNYTRVELSDNFEADNTKEYAAIITYMDGTFSNVLSCKHIDESGNRNYIDIYNFPDSDVEIGFITIGFQEELFLEFIIESIEKGDGDNTVKLQLVEYNAEVYDYAAIA